MRTIYKKLKFICIIAIVGNLLVSCADLDIPAPNVVQDADIFANESTILLYLSRMYSQMPFEDFKYSPKRQFFDDWLAIPDGNTGLMCINRDDAQTMTSEGYGRNGAYWSRAFASLRDANYLIENLPKYKGNFTEPLYNHCLGEAYFARAMVFYAMAKRYGGTPLVLKVLDVDLQKSSADLEIPRSTEKETWDQVSKDFDEAINLLLATSPQRGLANKYVALGFKSEAMLYAGSVAKYNKITGFGQKTGVRVIGFDPSTAAADSKKYFEESYKAAKQIIKSGKYDLYKKKWSASDKVAQYENMVDMFFDASSPENIYIKEYFYQNLTHSYDAYAVTRQLMGGNGYSCFANPTLDFVEMFDGLPKNADGTIKVFDKDPSDPDRKYVLYDHPMDMFRNAEPRLRAYVVFPMDIMKGESIDIRRGVFTGDVTGGIAPLMSVNGVVSYSFSGSVRYNSVDAYLGKGKFTKQELFACTNGSDQRTPVKVNINGKDTTINASGMSGPFNGDDAAANTGFTIRKWVNPAMTKAMTLEGRSTQHFVLMRYGEILLNAAEAAAELRLAGESTFDGDNLQAVAYDAIADIRERAGADALAGASDLDGQDGLMVIRKERTKELAYESKYLWDLRRWRTQHSDLINGFTESDGTYFRGLYPFYASKAGKYFFDARFDERNWRYRLTEEQYYLMIPGAEVSKSPVIDQQPGR